jgi:hypothetical protein
MSADTNNSRFILVAYKPNSNDYCRGCLMASYSGDFEVENHLTAEELTKKWATFINRNISLRINEAPYQFYIFKNGIKVWNEYYPSWDGEKIYGYDSDETDALANEDQKEINAIYNEAHALAKQEYKSRLEKEAAAKVEQQQADNARAKEDRLKIYTKLQAEFGKGETQ